LKDSPSDPFDPLLELYGERVALAIVVSELVPVPFLRFDAPVSPDRPQHQIDAAVKSCVPERHLEGNLGTDGPAAS
jgi:hypothetical protein